LLPNIFAINHSVLQKISWISRGCQSFREMSFI